MFRRGLAAAGVVAAHREDVATVEVDRRDVAAALVVVVYPPLVRRIDPRTFGPAAFVTAVLCRTPPLLLAWTNFARLIVVAFQDDFRVDSSSLSK